MTSWGWADRLELWLDRSRPRAAKVGAVVWPFHGWVEFSRWARWRPFGSIGANLALWFGPCHATIAGKLQVENGPKVEDRRSPRIRIMAFGTDNTGTPMSTSGTFDIPETLSKFTLVLESTDGRHIPILSREMPQ